jgi:phage terminase small subunit
MALTQKQETFALSYVETGNASEAYRRAYDADEMKPASIHVKACQLLANGKVRLRVNELQAAAAQKAQITLESHLRDLADLRDQAREARQFSAAITAEVARGKASGVHVEKTESTVTGANGGPLQMVSMTAQEFAEEARRVASEV